MSSNKNWDKDGGILDLKPGVRTVGTKNRAVRDRQDSTPDARTEDLLGILFRITKAVERACHEDSRIFIDKQFFHRTVTEDGKVITIFRHGAWVFLYNPLSGIAQILKSIGSDASRYAWTVRHLLVVGEFNLRAHLDSTEHTEVEKLYQMKLYLDRYKEVEMEPYSNVLLELINNFDSTIAELKSLINLLSSIWEEGNVLNLNNPPPPVPPSDAMTTNSDIIDLESETRGAMNPSNVDLEDEGDVDEGPGSPQSQSGSSTPTPSNPGTRARTPGYTGSNWSDTSTIRPALPSPPSPYRRTPSPKPFEYTSQSPPPTPPTTGFGYDPPPEFPRTPSPPPDPRTPSWKIFLSAKYPIEDLYVTQRDLAIFGEARQLARQALKEAQRVQRMCIRLHGLYWRANENYLNWKDMYGKADPELVKQVWEQLEREKEAEERQKSEVKIRKELGLGAVGVGRGRRRQLETVVEEEEEDGEEEKEEEEDDDLEMPLVGEEMELKQELGLGEEMKVDVDDEEAQLTYALDQIAAMERREASGADQPANLTIAKSRFSLDD